MNNIYQHYIIDLSSNNNFVQVPTVQGDGNGIRGFEVELIQNGVPYVIDRDDTFIFIMGTKPDTKQVMNGCTLTEHGSILVDITSQMSAVKGRGEYQIVLMSKSKNSQLKSFSFYIITTPSAFDMDYVASSDEFQALTRNIRRTEEVIDEANLAISDVRTLESSVRETENSRMAAENDRVNAEMARAAGENSRAAAETARQTAEAGRNDTENTRNENEAARQTNETARQTNEAARQTTIAAAIENVNHAADRANTIAATCEDFIDAGLVVQAEKGAAGGVATLSSNGQIPSEQIPASVARMTALDEQYEQLTAYTRQKIADLINGAPTTLDTLGEIAQAMEDNKTVVAALDVAIGKKANSAEFDSHVKDTTAHITAAERNNWNSKANASHTHNYAAAGHTHDDRYYTESEVDSKLGGKANSSHTHDDRYYTESEVNSMLSGKANSNHTHNYAASGHTHDDRYYTESEVDSKLGGKANSSHSHSYSEISGRPTFRLDGTTLYIDF